MTREDIQARLLQVEVYTGMPAGPGLSLFTRTPRGLSPTAAGLQLAKSAERLLGFSVELETQARQLRGSPVGRLAVGTIEDPQLLALLPARGLGPAALPAGGTEP